MGEFLVKMKNAFVSIERGHWTHIHEFQLSHEGVSEVSEQAHERSKQAKRA